VVLLRVLGHGLSESEAEGRAVSDLVVRMERRGRWWRHCGRGGQGRGREGVPVGGGGWLLKMGIT